MHGDIMKNSKQRKTITEELTGTVTEIINQIKKLINKGNARRIIIRNKEGKILFQSQLTAGIAGTAAITAIAPIMSAISTFALLMNDVKIIVEKYPAEQGSGSDDEYEVEAEFIEIKDEEDEEEPSPGKDRPNKKDQTDKTVGRDNDPME